MSTSIPTRGLALIAALARDNIIGKDGDLPWRLPEDLKHFKQKTLGHALIMGRKTFASIGKPLPGRRNIVLTTQADLCFEGCEMAPCFSDALQMAYEHDPMPFVIGGAAVYAEALPYATHLFFTEIDWQVDGDTIFPNFDRSEFVEVSRRAGQTEGVSFVELIRGPAFDDVA